MTFNNDYPTFSSIHYARQHHKYYTDELKELLKPYAKITDLFYYLKTEEFNKEMIKNANSEEIENTISTLRDYVVNNFAISTDIHEIPTDLVNESALDLPTDISFGTVC